MNLKIKKLTYQNKVEQGNKWKNIFANNQWDKKNKPNQQKYIINDQQEFKMYWIIC